MADAVYTIEIRDAGGTNPSGPPRPPGGASSAPWLGGPAFAGAPPPLTGTPLPSVGTSLPPLPAGTPPPLPGVPANLLGIQPGLFGGVNAGFKTFWESLDKGAGTVDSLSAGWSALTGVLAEGYPLTAEFIGGLRSGTTAVTALASAASNAAVAAGNFAAAGMSFNGTQIARGMFDLAGAIPVVGGAISTFGSTILGLGDAVANTANRLAQYSPQLAMQQAMFEVRSIFRDMERAQDPALVATLEAAMEARKQFEEKMEDMFLEFAPTVLEVLKFIFDMLKAMTDGFKIMAGWVRSIWEGIKSLFGIVEGASEEVRAAAQRISPEAVFGQEMRRLFGDQNQYYGEDSARRVSPFATPPNFPAFRGGV